MWLEVLSGEDAGRVVEVDRPLVLGRVQGADLVIRDARASRRHAELAPEAGGLRLRDLGSANGTLVDGEPAQRARCCTAARRSGSAACGSRCSTAEPAVTGAPIAEPVRPGVAVETEGPSWSMIGRIVEARTRRGRRLTSRRSRSPPRRSSAVAVLALHRRRARTSASPPSCATWRPATVRVEARSVGQPQRAGQRLGARPRRRAARHRRARRQPRPALLRRRTREARVVGVAPCEDLAVLRVAGGAARASRSALGDADAGRDRARVRLPRDGAGRRAGVLDARRRLRRAHVVPRSRRPTSPPTADAIRTDTALDPRLLRRPARRPRRARRRASTPRRGRRAPTGGRCRARTTPSPPTGRATCSTTLRAGRSIALDRARASATRRPRDLASRGLPPGLWVQGVVPGHRRRRAPGWRTGTTSSRRRPPGRRHALGLVRCGRRRSRAARPPSWRSMRDGGRQRTVRVRFE